MIQISLASTLRSSSVSRLVPASLRLPSQTIRYVLLLALASCLGATSLTISAQTKEWIWTQGSSSVGQPGVYGTIGVPAPTNYPGAREFASLWMDANGNRWLFGGSGYAQVRGYGYLNDLWKFDASTQQWTWMGGSSTVPTATGSILGQPGVYGTLGVAAAGNIPGGRDDPSAWTDTNGDFWLFGGYGFDSTGNVAHALNDLWRLSPSSGLWTWMGGSSNDKCAAPGTSPCGTPGVYGTRGVAAAGNVPGGRDGASIWTPADGKIWLFGGGGVDSAGTSGPLNDLWMFDPASQQWTWEGGNSTVAGNNIGRAGVYGTLGIAAPANIPGGRGSATAWIDASGKFWLFGGYGADSAGENGALNDLWVYDSATGEWAWMSGTSTIPSQGRDGGVTGVYGTLGVPASGNVPGSRSGADGWTDSSGNLWLFGGYAYFIPQFYNDTWMFSPASKEWTWMGGSDTLVIEGTPGLYGTQGVPAASNAPGGRDGANLWIDGTGNIWLFGGFGCDASSFCGNDALNDLWTFTSNLQTTPSIRAAPAQTSISTAQTLSVDLTVASIAGGPTPTGSVTLAGGAYTSSAIALNQGGATINIPAGSFGAGSVTLSFTYMPDAASASLYKNASGTVAITVTQPAYTLSATAVTVSPGGSTTSTVTANSTTAYAGTITLSCKVTSSPTGAVDLPGCAGSQSAALSSTATTASVSITVTTTAPSRAALQRPKSPSGWNPVETAILALLLWFGFPARRRELKSFLGIVVLTAVLCTLMACGGSSTKPVPNPGTTPGAYAFAVTGTGNDTSATTAATTFTLTVN